MNQEFLTAYAQILQNCAAGISRDFPEVTAAMTKKPFRATETGVHPKLMADWNRKGLLIADHEKNKRHDFSLTEFVWIKMIEKMREYNFSLEFIRAFRNEVVAPVPIKVDSVLKSPEMRQAMVNMFPPEHQEKVGLMFSQPEMVEKLLAAIPQGMVSNHLDGHIVFALLVKRPISFLIDQNGRGTVFSPVIFEHSDVDHQPFFDMVARSHVSISLTEVLAEVLTIAPIEKVSGKLQFLTDSEALVFKALKEEDVLSVKVKFDDRGEMDLMEVTEGRAVDKGSRLMELILMNGYQNITIKTQKGAIVRCENTRKVKLK